MKTYARIVAAAAVVCAVAGITSAADVMVAPDGDDANPGTAGKPVATLEAAAARVRAMRRAEPDRAAPIVVEVRGGTYEMARAWTLTPEDSGTEASPTIYRAAEGERPVLSGGTALRGWKVEAGNRWTTTLPAVAAGSWRFSQLWVDGQRRYRPRFPAAGYLRVQREVASSEANRSKGHDRFAFAAGDVDARWVGREEVEFVMFHIWTASRMRLASVDEAERVATFTGPTRSTAPWCAFGTGKRYYVEGVREMLDEPGEWMLEHATGELTYLAREGETPERAAVVAPRLDRLIVLAGEGAAGRWVEHVRFEGLTLSHGNYTAPPGGQSFPQAEINVGGVVEAVAARDIAFADCAVTHVGRYAFSIGAGCGRVTIERCEMVDLGGGGVLIGTTGGKGSWPVAGGENTGGDASEVSHVSVRDCTIVGAGRVHSAAVGVWIGHASHCTVEHNEIADLYYTAVSVGWQWGYQPSRSNHNLIRWNHMHDIGQGVLSDMAGVYTLGVSPGTRVEFNRIHDVDAFDYGGWGLYTDEGSTGIVMSHNLVYRTKTGGFHQHYGRDNRITNNILVDARTFQLQRTRVEDHLSFTFDRNVVAWTNDAPLMQGDWAKNVKLEGNVYWNGERELRFPGGVSLRQRQESGQDAGSVHADPLFANAGEDDYRLDDASPALKLGFERWDAAKAGRVTPRDRTGDLPPVPRAYP